MKKLLFLNIVLLILLSCKENEKEITLKSTEFLELNEKFEIYNGSIPNGWNGDIMVAMSGTVLADRRSVDGGAGKKPENFMYRSKDNGQTWVKEDIVRHPDINGWVPIISGCEEGITLRHGKHAGRLLLPSRVLIDYNASNDSLLPYHYSSANYSDDGGKTWYTSAPFPVAGTGEGALVELSDGTIYYNSRNHSRDGNRDIALSYDGGETWRDHYIDPTLPDGPPRVYGNKAGLVRLEIADHDILIFSMTDNPNGPTAIHSTAGRINITVWASFDGGKTWPVKRLVSPKGGYSHLAAGRPGTPSQGLIYLTTEGLFARFNLDWVLSGKDWHEFIKN